MKLRSSHSLADVIEYEIVCLNPQSASRRQRIFATIVSMLRSWSAFKVILPEVTMVNGDGGGCQAHKISNTESSGKTFVSKVKLLCISVCISIQQIFLVNGVHTLFT